jgi:hypothetical protein
MPLTLVQETRNKGTKKMAEAFNLNKFLNEQATYNSRKYVPSENGKAAMEARAIQKAEEAVNKNQLLGITLSEKISELGIGERVIQQLGDTAVGAVKNIVSPLTDWLEKYEHVYDENIFKTEIQSMGKQMFFAKQALTAEIATSELAQNFIMDM